MSEPVLVAVHGNFASARWWADLLAAPPQGWRVLAPDLPGFAGTAPAGEISIARYAEWLAQWVQAQGVTKAVFLGHSLGGAVVMELARQHPELVGGLILAASSPLSGLVTPAENYPVLELLRGNPQMLEMSLAALFSSRKPGNFGDLVEDGGRMDAGQYSGNARALEQWRVEPQQLPKVPVLVLGGSEDRLITPDMVRSQAAQFGGEAQIFEGAGHGFPQERPAEFRASLDAFLNSLPR